MPTEQPNPPAPTDYAAPRVLEQPESSPGGTTPEAPRVIEQDTPSPLREDPLVLTDSVFYPPSPYPPKQPPRIVITDKINQRIMKEQKQNQPFNNHKHGTRLATCRVTRLTCSGVNKTSYHSQATQYLEAS